MLVQTRLAQCFVASCRSRFVVRSVHTQVRAVTKSRSLKPLLWCSALAISAALALKRTVHLDSEVVPDDAGEETRIDPATSIAFPTTLRIPSKTPLPTFTLVGVGVRTVSFLGIKVYSVGFYADLANPKLNIPKSASPEEKVEHIVRNSACVLRIVPTRSTSYSHLRDGFMRTMQARLLLSKKRGSLSPEEEFAVQSPLRKFKSIFPNTPLAKHTPLDIMLAPPSLDSKQPRSLVIRDLGAVQSNWLATEFVLAYFEGDGLSPPLKQSVISALNNFGK
ncbi:uncharacterized protein LAESUDRAFT_726177 [Laetiporus sulphureus 93-53]|uniref:Chalcone isomerase domain-containing protein n=1 Tax=Laetiporus sulphureus 93-53 TaxID=1314785 RepID=A0A165E6Q6_9APHY|nr:uncharacterized protein LAESUDRAFT_726177 [Laetiporus sulphureus 93-53]KZT06344.1 hypothetical protein LAESUDRAFT_726177 [Laetiporus sulphureus 93-53]